METSHNDIERSKYLTNYYKKNLNNVDGIRFLDDMENVIHNYSYFPVFIDQSKFKISRDKLFLKLQEKNVLSRRYFYPLITEFPTYKNLPSANPDHLKNAKKISEEILCLPIYAQLSFKEIDYIINIITLSNE